MRRITITISILAGIVALADVAIAGGPLGSNGTTARRYAASSFPLRYTVDPGPLGSMSNATGVTIVNYAFAQWAGVKSATLRFINNGYLSHDVTSAADPLISGSTQFSDGINPIVFDADGSITDAKLGSGAHNSVLGFAGSAYSGNTYVEGYAIINGALSGTGTQSTIDQYEAVLTHEIGHFLGLGHSQVSMHGDFCTMYPVIEKTSQKVLSPDDTTAIANLYPAPGFTSLNGSITGTVRTPAGLNLSGVNVIAEDATTGVSYSTVVDYYSGGKSGYDSPPAATGTYMFSNVHPGQYNIRIEPMNASFSGGSSVASYYTPINSSVAREWWNGAGETGDMLTDNASQHTAVTVSAGLTTSGINIISNESATLTALTYHNGTPYYIWSLPYSGITKYAIRCTAPAKGTLTEVQFRLDPSSVLPAGGTMTITVHANAAGSYAGVPGAVLGSVTIPYTELAADQVNEVYLGGLGAAVAFDSNATFHISFATNGIGSPVFYTDNGTPTQNRTSYFNGTWYNFPDGGWAGGYNLIASAIFSKSPIAVPVVTNPIASITPTALNFGNVAIHQTLDGNVRLTNSGTANLVVSGVSIIGVDSIDYGIISGGGAFTLAAGTYRDITVRFYPCNMSGPEGPTRSATLMISSNAATSPDHIPLVGTATAPVPLMAVTPIRFGTVRPGMSSTFSGPVIINAGNDTLKATKIALMGFGADSGIVHLLTPAGAQNILPDSQYRVSIVFSPTSLKNYQGALRMYHNADLGFTDVPFAANASAGELRVDSALTFSTGSGTAEKVELRNVGNAPLFVKGISIRGVKDSIEGSYFQIAQALPLVIPPYDSVALPLQFEPTAGPGEYIGTLQLYTDSYLDSIATVAIVATVGQEGVAEGTHDAEWLGPNPAHEILRIHLSPDVSAQELSVLDITGKALMTRAIGLGEKSLALDVDKLPSGEYVAVIRGSSGNSFRRMRFVVEH